MMTNMNGNNVGNNGGQFGDTTLTKVFVGGLAWETPKEAMRDHFHKFGEILEAVIISDKITGRSKGYGFVTFKDAEAAKKACEDPTPVINGRRANCNLASLGARRTRPPTPAAAAGTPPPPPQQVVTAVGPRSTSAAPAGHVQWYYPPASPYHHHHHQHHHPAIPFYGYSPAYYAADVNYSHKMGYNAGGSYVSGAQLTPQVYQGQAMVGAHALTPMYPLYNYHHQVQTMGLPAHMFAPTTPGPMATGPTLVTKPASMAPPNSVCLAVE